MRFAAFGVSLVLGCAVAHAGKLDYQLVAQEIAQDTYLFEGYNEDFSPQNGGNIINTAFIVTEDGVVVINAGPSKLYGEQMKAAIAEVTNQPVVRIFVSKLHPDHFLGAQVYPLVTVSALPETVTGISTQGEQFVDNMYRMVGPWMLGTEVTLPNDVVGAQTIEFGGHELELIALSGHTPSDLVILDRTTGTLFAGGVVFHDRAPTTPHADLARWRESLNQLDALSFQRLVPSHGPVAHDHGPIEQTRRYVEWLDTVLRAAADDGLDMAEVLETPLPESFASMAVMPGEFHRSVSHLYPPLERAALPPAADQGEL